MTAQLGLLFYWFYDRDATKAEKYLTLGSGKMTQAKNIESGIKICVSISWKVLQNTFRSNTNALGC